MIIRYDSWIIDGISSFHWCQHYPNYHRWNYARNNYCMQCNKPVPYKNLLTAIQLHFINDPDNPRIIELLQKIESKVATIAKYEINTVYTEDR